jgi:hypothetical protein
VQSRQRRQTYLGFPGADRDADTRRQDGRGHYAGPTWEDVDGSVVTGKAIGNVPGATANDILWLRLNVVNHRGSGILADVSTVQRLDTHGGVLQGTCDRAGDFASVPYSATYVFLRKGG